MRQHDGAGTLGGGVVLGDDGSPPVDDRLLHRHGARCRAVNDEAERRQVVAFLDLVRQRQQPVEHGRHHVRVRNAMAFDELERLPRVPPVHQHDADAARLRYHERQLQRCRVVQRARAEMKLPSPGAVARGPGERGGRGGGGCRGRDIAVHAFRPAGRARGVEHPGPDARLVDVVAGLGRQRVGVRLEAVDVATHHQPHGRVRRVRGRDGGDVAIAGVGYHRARLTVVDDVRSLLTGEVPVHGCQAEAGAIGCNDDFDELRAVRAKQRDTRPWTYAASAQCTHQPVRLSVQLGERRDPVTFHHRRFVGVAGRPVRHHHAVAHRVEPNLSVVRLTHPAHGA